MLLCKVLQLSSALSDIRTSANVGDEVIHVLVCKQLCEQTRPVGLNLDIGC